MKNIISKLFIYSIFFIALSGCYPGGQSNSYVKTQTTGLELSSQQVTSSDELTLSFPQKHPAKLAIKDPKGVWFVVHEEGINTRLMSNKEFMQTTSLTLHIPEITGVTWIDGKRIEKPVFSIPGEYIIYMADNLETEPENTFYLTKTLTYK